MMAEQTTAAPAADIVIKLDSWATITVPVSEVADCAAMKAEQSALLSRLVSDQTAGFQLEMSQIDLVILASLATELAYTVNKLTVEIAHGFGASTKGGV